MLRFYGSIFIKPSGRLSEVAQAISEAFAPLRLEATRRFDEVPGYTYHTTTIDISLQGIPEEDYGEPITEPFYWLTVLGTWEEWHTKLRFLHNIPLAALSLHAGNLEVSSQLLAFVSGNTSLECESAG